MSPRTKEQIEEIRTERREAILEAALYIFAEQGYHSASISRIAKKAGISKGLIYNYFKSKEHLLVSLVDEMVEKMMSRFPPTDQEPSDVLMEQFIDLSFDVILEDLMHAKLFFSLYVQPEVLALVSDKMMERALPFMQFMTRYFKSKGHENPETIMRFFTASIDGVQMHIIMDPAYPVEETKEILKNQFIRS